MVEETDTGLRRKIGSRINEMLNREDIRMKRKKSTLFLWISLAVFAASVLAVILFSVQAKAELDEILAKDTDTIFRSGMEESFVWMILILMGILANELSFIRSTYKRLKHRMQKWAGVCYVASAALAGFAAVFCTLIFLNGVQFVSASGRDYTGDVYFLALPLSFLVSFVLGSMPVITEPEGE